MRSVGLFDFLRGKPDADPILGNRTAEPSGLEVRPVEGSGAWTSSSTSQVNTFARAGGEPMDPLEPARTLQGAAAPADAIAKLERLAALHQRGALTDAEFAAAKAKLLGS